MLSWIGVVDARTVAETIAALTTALAIVVGGGIAWRRFVVAGGGYGARCDLRSEISTDVIGQDVVLNVRVVARNPGAANLRLDTTDPVSGLVQIKIVDDATLVAAADPEGTRSDHHHMVWSAAEVILTRAFRHISDPTQWRITELEAGQEVEDSLAIALPDSASHLRAVQMAVTMAARRRKLFRWQSVEYWTHVASAPAGSPKKPIDPQGPAS